MEKKFPPVRLGISSCLLGERVRYDGNHKLDRFLLETLGRYIQWVAVCPEVESGLGVPREAMRLVEKEGKISLVTINSGMDLTAKVSDYSREKAAQIKRIRLCGFVFKSKSPTSGLKDVKIYNENGGVKRKGTGIFASEFIKKNWWLPVEDNGRLHNPEIRENFLERVFVYARWCDLINGPLSIKALVDWHTDHKLLIMAHSPSKVKALGQLLSSNPKNIRRVYYGYFTTLMQIVKTISTVKKNVNVLQHIAGYFKKDLSRDEKAELVEVIENYHSSLVPLIVPITLLNHYVRKYNKTYLKRQVYLNPHPLELKLRNHL
ncbi:Hypothetical protein CHISP_2736 [Chitinispirillum alkaliphilum]|nr:Hypothetical protein CHISP_2736 [Chitinispirillum alkaliphilum]